MPVDLTIQGADKLEHLAYKLKETGNKEMRRELFRAVNRATKPMRDAARHAARENLPRRGGLNEWVAASKFSTSTRTGRDVRVAVKGNKSGHDLRALDRGRLRHPLFGNRSAWFTQEIRAGWFTEAMQRESPRVGRVLLTVFDVIARDLERSV